MAISNTTRLACCSNLSEREHRDIRRLPKRIAQEASNKDEEVSQAASSSPHSRPNGDREGLASLMLGFLSAMSVKHQRQNFVVKVWCQRDLSVIWWLHKRGTRALVAFVNKPP
ncbi:hypothetical protein I7I51_05101 [Histoplasma capsulatum]|uniref:Uncharacterized protein n=1 Tax=Ajellomyces capsulatus TaxID=5037 RepID=A0A8A1M6N9_AJECA|nr:hypothetical protein I7I51_05101 [Histoplasma capsulatum]